MKTLDELIEEIIKKLEKDDVFPMYCYDPESDKTFKVENQFKHEWIRSRLTKIAKATIEAVDGDPEKAKEFLGE